MVDNATAKIRLIGGQLVGPDIGKCHISLQMKNTKSQP